MRFGLLPSLLLHGGAAYALFRVWDPTGAPIEFVPAVPVEVISEAELAELVSVPEEIKVEDPAEDVPPAVPEDIEEAPPAPDPEPQPDPVEPDPEPDPVPPAPDPEPDPPAPDPEPPTPDPTPPPDDDELDFGALSDTLGNLDPDANDRRRPSEISDDATGSDRNIEGIGEGRELTITEETRFQAWLERCWTPVTGTPDPSKLVVSLELTFRIDGTLQEVDVLNDGQISRSGDSYWTAARQRALAAANECSPFEFLDPARYDTWQVVRMNFTPPY